jgi:two-component system NtrC family sensor kinase
VVYTLAAATVVGLYFALVAGVATAGAHAPAGYRTVGLILAVVVTALLFDPVRKWIQDRVDHLFYRTVYDYRRTLIEFGRELSSETDLERAAVVVLDRLSRTLAVDRIAIFLRERGRRPFACQIGGHESRGELDLSFLSAPRPEPAGTCSSRTRIRCRAKPQARRKRSPISI